VATGPEPDGGVRLAVRDEGQGIAEAVATRLFQPFVTSKPNGLGLGLSICRSIVEAHGGKLAAFNNADRGATFSVALPARAEAAE
jgi:two-component system sensor kinase FixL